MESGLRFLAVVFHGPMDKVPWHLYADFSVVNGPKLLLLNLKGTNRLVSVSWTFPLWREPYLYVQWHWKWLEKVVSLQMLLKMVICMYQVCTPLDSISDNKGLQRQVSENGNLKNSWKRVATGVKKSIYGHLSSSDDSSELGESLPRRLFPESFRYLSRRQLGAPSVGWWLNYRF